MEIMISNIRNYIVLVGMFIFSCRLLSFDQTTFSLPETIENTINKHIIQPKNTNNIKLKKLSINRIERLVNRYHVHIETKRTTELLQGATKVGCISGIVYLLYHMTLGKDNPADMKLDYTKRIVNDVIIGTVIVLLTNGLNSAIANISRAWENDVAKRCSNNLLRRFLFEIRRYKYLIASLSEETPFIWDYEIVMAYNQIVTSLEHIIAWQYSHNLEAQRKIVYKSLNTFVHALDEYKDLLIETRKNKWSEEYRKKLISYTHSFLFPWIEIIAPEVSHD